MQDLVVCVGEKCHQSGAELVLKTFLDLIERGNLNHKICLKCSFAIGGCCERDEVSVRFGERRFQVNPSQAELSFQHEVLSTLLPATEV